MLLSCAGTNIWACKGLLEHKWFSGSQEDVLGTPTAAALSTGPLLLSRLASRTAALAAQFMSRNSPRDIISITALSLRTPCLERDLWHRPSKPQPLLLSLWISTSITSEASVDNLLGGSLNYGFVTKALEKAVASLDPSSEIALEVLADHLAATVLFTANAPNVRIELTRPRALLSAAAIGVEIYRTHSDYLTTSSPYSLDLKSPNSPLDTFFVRALRRLIIIGINACERLDEQEVIVDLSFSPSTTMPFLGTAARPCWTAWRPVVKSLESYLSTSAPLTIEAPATALAQIILTPSTPGWDVPTTTVRIAKSHALMFAQFPAVQVTRERSDFFLPSGKLRAAGMSTVATEGTHRVILGVGTNMGERVGNISKALKELERERQEGTTKVVATSAMYESDAMYVTDQAAFLNAAVEIETTLSPLALLALLKTTEDALGREKTFRNGPRVIDLDILFYDDLVYDSRDDPSNDLKLWLKIPHASIAEREFVLRPLADLTTISHPTLHLTPSSLLSTLLLSTPSTTHRVLPLSSTTTHALGTRTLLMSILNATPDSFSDGGDNLSLSTSLSTALSHLSHGADILDIGGMSTRPGATAVDERTEIARVVPLLRGLRAQGVSVPISIDTFRPAVARAAVEAGATIINDVLGGAEEGMLETMAELDVPVVLMHSRGTPETMSRMTGYGGDIVGGVRGELGERVQRALEAGVKRWNIIVDPGVGFAKTGEDNLVLLRQMREVIGEGELGKYPSLVGLSRKRFLGTITGKEAPKERVWGTAAGVTASVAGGADIVRVHDVAEMIDVVRVADGIYRA